MHTKETPLIEVLQSLLESGSVKEPNLTIIKENKLLDKLKLLFETKTDKKDEEDEETKENIDEDVPTDENIENENTNQQPPKEENIDEDVPEEQPESNENIDQQPPQEENMEGGEEQYQDSGETDGGEFQDDPGMEGETTLEDVGKMYELKQIHYRLIAVRNHLEIFVEEEFDEVKNTLTKAIALFDLVIDNYDKYKEKIDEIIVMYYKFIQDVYELTKKKYKKYVNKHKKKNAGL